MSQESNFIPARTSPKRSKRGCLCKDGKTYSRKCCDGSLHAQGIGVIQGPTDNTNTTTNTNQVRTITQ